MCYNNHSVYLVDENPTAGVQKVKTISKEAVPSGFKSVCLRLEMLLMNCE